MIKSGFFQNAGNKLSETPDSLCNKIERKSLETSRFPPKEDFYSNLVQKEVNDDEYEKAKSLYETRICLSKHDPNRWYNFADYLKYYNLLDVVPLVTAVSNCFSKFFEHFGIDPALRLSLPSISFDAMFAMFDQSMPYVATVSAKNDYIRQLYRGNVFGGIVNTPHRDIDLMTDTSPLRGWWYLI